jgi:hypothetical protein
LPHLRHVPRHVDPAQHGAHVSPSERTHRPRQIFKLLLSRMVRFNSAPYLTFASILLLGIAALSFV